ncbi:dTDP-4-dehydrorhamnose 3,5-epimerase [Microvirga subterranea]|uniref:dTDP-4-dehydrorhamnose 3,5-epimerase n=1 Tax=Microvirga subterranea TaxID=186651 RepID=A0A370HHP3_9HYPH|nr:dTDP-4-dehydrorhamnose 3,5-epimerase [Microvirga subterranea]RDI54840.1 dTDP-4-dehydrorhamnose 3,5-epimerase [Microvirga subterranea]
MRIESLSIPGLFLVHPDRHQDARGFFARTYCRETFLRHGLADCSLQCSVSHNVSRGTLRGMHFQSSPHTEAKLVRCSRGRAFDVAVDVRPDSTTFGRWFGIEISVENGVAIYIPRGFAHGFVALEDETDLFYQMAEPFVPAAAAGFRWDDPDVGIEWPTSPAVISERDASLPLLRNLQHV